MKLHEQLAFPFAPKPAPEYPDVPGHRGVETSVEAAEAVAPSAKTVRFEVWSLLREGGLTAHEVANALDMPNTTTAPRITELNRMGLVEDSGERRRNGSGKRAIVWRVVT